MSPETRFFLPSGTIVIVVLAVVSVLVLYGPLQQRDSLPIGLVLIGAVSCSLALILVFFLVRPSRD